MALPTILLAEDDETDVFLLRRALQKAALTYPLVVARDGQEAIDLLDPEPFNEQALSPRPGLLLLDLKMPRLSGFDVLAWLQGQPTLKSLPVVVLSASNHEEDIHRAGQLGAIDYKVKPSRSEELVGLLLELEARYLQGGLAAGTSAAGTPVPPPL